MTKSFQLNIDYSKELPAFNGVEHAWLITIKATRFNEYGTKPIYWKVTKAKPTVRQLRKCVKAFNKFNRQ